MKFVHLVALAGLVGLSFDNLSGQDIPSEAEAQFKRFQTEVEAIRKKADSDVADRVERVTAVLQGLQDLATKKGDLDGALAIRSIIRQINAGTYSGKAPAPAVVDKRPEKANPRTEPKIAPPPIVRTEPVPTPKPIRKIDDPLEVTVVTAIKLPDLKLPSPTTPATAIGGTRKESAALNTTLVKLTAATIVGDLIWTAKGDAFFALTADGVLSRVTLNGFVEATRLDLERRCGFLALSAEGLLATMTDLQEVWMIDPTSLQIKKRIAAPGVKRALSGPTLKFALAAGTGEQSRGGRLDYLDLMTGQPVHEWIAPTQHARLTPDGKHYFAQGDMEQLAGYRVEGKTLIPQPTSPRIAQNGQSISVSSDSKYVCLPSAGGNSGIGSNYSTAVFPTDNLSKAEFALASGAFPRVVGFDPAASLVYAQNHDSNLIVFTATGIKRSEHKLSLGSGRGEESRQFVAHPEGGKLLVLTGSALMFVELVKR